MIVRARALSIGNGDVSDKVPLKPSSATFPLAHPSGGMWQHTKDMLDARDIKIKFPVAYKVIVTPAKHETYKVLWMKTVKTVGENP